MMNLSLCTRLRKSNTVYIGMYIYKYMCHHAIFSQLVGMECILEDRESKLYLTWAIFSTRTPTQSDMCTYLAVVNTITDKGLPGVQ